jgi:hypothetical protein
MGFSPHVPFRSLIWKNSPLKSCAKKQESDRLQYKGGDSPRKHPIPW